jgi:5'-nucleotidase
MKNRPLIFVTNDDSYLSKGFEAMVSLAQEFGDVVAIAPDRVQSGMSQAITINSPLFLRSVKQSEGVEIYAFSGTPVDCAKFAFDHLFENRRVDLVLSGINHGSNAAVNVMYSGTMGAAIEGSFYGCPSVGLSLTDHDAEADFEAAKHYAREIISSIMENPASENLCLNVNVPNIPLSEIKGVRVCRQCRGIWLDEFAPMECEDQKQGYMISGAFSNHEPEAEDTDEWALANGYVSVVPVQIDMTHYKQMGYLERVLG